MPEGGIVITLADIYRQLVGLDAKVGASLARQEQAERVIAEHDAALRPLLGLGTQVADHETRMRAIERTRWPITSMTVLLGLASLALAAMALYARK